MTNRNQTSSQVNRVTDSVQDLRAPLINANLLTLGLAASFGKLASESNVGSTALVRLQSTLTELIDSLLTPFEPYLLSALDLLDRAINLLAENRFNIRNFTLAIFGAWLVMKAFTIAFLATNNAMFVFVSTLFFASRAARFFGATKLASVLWGIAVATWGVWGAMRSFVVLLVAGKFSDAAVSLSRVRRSLLGIATALGIKTFFTTLAATPLGILVIGWTKFLALHIARAVIGVALAVKALAAASWAAAAGLFAMLGPIGVAIVAVIALGVAAYLLYRNWDKVVNFFKNSDNPIARYFRNEANQVIEAINTIINAINSLLNALNRIPFRVSIPGFGVVGGGSASNIPLVPRVQQWGSNQRELHMNVYAFDQEGVEDAVRRALENPEMLEWTSRRLGVS